MIAFAALTLALATSALPDSAPGPARIARMNAYVDRLEAFGFSGQIVVEEHGAVILERSCGLADRRTRTPVRPETIFGIGSITKTFTAAAILRLESQGRLSASDRLSKHLPGVPADKAEITLDQLLSHRAGLRLDADLPDSSSRDDVVRRILAQPLKQPPGQGFSYSNIGFDLLAAVVERVSGTDYDSFVRREFLDRAHMDHTARAGASRLSRLPAARGETEWGEASALTEWPRAWHGTGAGRMVSNAEDLRRWTHALRDGRVLTPRERDAMFARHALEPDSSWYGYGMQLVTLADGTQLAYHGGDVPGYRSEMRMYETAQRRIVVLTNQDLWALGVQRRVIASRLSLLAQGKPAELPPEPRPPTPSEPAIGTWRLPGGGVIEVRDRDGRLALAARGADAVDLFEADPRDSLSLRRDAVRKTRALLAAAVQGDSTAARGVLTKDEYDLGWDFLRAEFVTLARTVGTIDSVECLGATTLPFAGFGTRCYFAVHVAGGTRGGFVGWNDGVLYDVTFGDDRPAPTLLPVAPLAAGGYAAYDLIRGREILFRVEETRLWFGAPVGAVAAERVRPDPPR